MKVLVTGAKGFIGKNLCLALKARDHEVLSYDIENTKEELIAFLKEADFVFHLAGINRPKNVSEFESGNKVFTEDLLQIIIDNKLTCPLVFTSSIQAAYDNDYGRSKKAAEDVIYKYAKETGNLVYVLRLPNMFGKWSRPNYNSVIATWCYNIARDLPIVINDENVVLELTYIDDLVELFISLLESKKEVKNYKIKSYKKSLGYIAKTLQKFKESRQNLDVSFLQTSFDQKLYATYLSYLPEDDFAYDLVSHSDHRGSFTEMLHLKNMGQISVNIIKPGITKGNHYHHTKNEKYVVVKGTCVIRFRKVNTTEIIEYEVSDEQFKTVDIPPGYTHSIKNIGSEDAIVFMWANEEFNPLKPDTYYEEV